MSESDRRKFLKGILSNLARSVGSVVVAFASVSAVKSEASATKKEETLPQDNILARADLLVENGLVEATEMETAQFLNYGFGRGRFGNGLLGGFRNGPFGGFGNGPLGGFRNGAFGGFGNTPLGGFRNSPLGGFQNTPFGAFSNGGWPNGGFGGYGGFSNGGWRNGGFGGGGWVNW